MKTHQYNLDNISFLELDIKNILDRIELLYALSSQNGQLIVGSKVKYDPAVFAFGNEATRKFNDMLPTIKSIHKDMYSVIEALFKNKAKTNKDVKQLEKTYPKLELFRDLNNKFKHFETSSKYDEIRVVQTAIPDREVIEIWIQFIKGAKIEHILYPEFIAVFVKILWDYGIVELS